MFGIVDQDTPPLALSSHWNAEALVAFAFNVIVAPLHFCCEVGSKLMIGLVQIRALVLALPLSKHPPIPVTLR